MDFEDLGGTFGDVPMQPQQTAASMQQLLNNNPVPQPQPYQTMQWTASTQPSSELPSLGMQTNRPPVYPAHSQVADYDRPLSAVPRFNPPQPLHPREMHLGSHQSLHHPPQAKEQSEPQQIPHAAPSSPSNDFALDNSPPIESHVVDNMGGLRYADVCKEKAREAFKEMKKNAHMQSGEFDRIKRRKKGDTTMSPREKYIRRLKMNQDSAAAARHAQEVYVHVLEKLVTTTEEEKRALVVEVQQLRTDNSRLNEKVSHIQNRTDEPVQLNLQTLFDDREGLRNADPVQVAKIVDLMTSPEQVSAQRYDPDFTNNMNNGPTSAA